MTHARSRGLWQARVADYDASGLTMREWCERNGFRDGQLRYWLKRARDAGESQSWACVELVDEGISGRTESNPLAADGVQVTVRVGSATVEVRSGFDPSLLSEVLRVVVATC
ncbi:MAG: IS66 family insertion sequence element accessory protein TnpA [Armatimonadota bacterium]